MKKAILGLFISVSLTGVANAQDAPPPPCGPKGDLPPSLSTNVAADSRCFEIRMYTANTMRNGGGDYALAIDELHQRFREEEVAIFEKHGAEFIAAWKHSCGWWPFAIELIGQTFGRSSPRTRHGKHSETNIQLVFRSKRT